MGWVAVMGGGALGALARFLFAGAVQRLTGPGFPWGTLAVNVVGAFIMGILVEAMAIKFSVSNETRLFLTTGALGGFTTFSAFTLETVTMLERGDLMPALFYIAASVGLCVLALYGGLMLVRTAPL